MTLKKRNVVLIGIIALAVFYTPSLLELAQNPKVEWRYRALALKAKGEIKSLDWVETLIGVTPLSWRTALDWPALHLVQLEKHTPDEAPCPALWRTPTGRFWGRLNDQRLLENLIAEQLLERIYDRPSAGIRAGDVVVDVGGHLGTFTRFALIQGADKVVTFEPEPTNIACFKKSFSDEIAQGRVILVEAAAWEKREELRFALDPTDPNTGMGQVRGDGHLTVQGVTIDDTLAELGVTTVDFIKMDIEGAERHALAGAHVTLSVQAPRMALCVYHRGDDREVIPERVLAIRSSYEILMGPDQAYFYDRP